MITKQRYLQKHIGKFRRSVIFFLFYINFFLFRIQIIINRNPRDFISLWICFASIFFDQGYNFLVHSLSCLDGWFYLHFNFHGMLSLSSHCISNFILRSSVKQLASSMQLYFNQEKSGSTRFFLLLLYFVMLRFESRVWSGEYVTCPWWPSILSSGYRFWLHKSGMTWGFRDIYKFLSLHRSLWMG